MKYQINFETIQINCINTEVFSCIFHSFIPNEIKDRKQEKSKKMNKLISLIFLIVSVIVLANAKRSKVALLNYNDLDTHWNTFKAKSGKKFSSSSHESRR